MIDRILRSVRDLATGDDKGKPAEWRLLIDGWHLWGGPVLAVFYSPTLAVVWALAAGFGKQIAQARRMKLIGDALGDMTSITLSTVVALGWLHMEGHLETWRDLLLAPLWPVGVAILPAMLVYLWHRGRAR